MGRKVIRKYKWHTEWAILKKDFQQLFKMPFGDFYDPLLSLVSGKYTIDAIRFDEALHVRFGQYEDLGLSMRDLVLVKYGRTALNCLESIL